MEQGFFFVRCLQYYLKSHLSDLPANVNTCDLVLAFVVGLRVNSAVPLQHSKKRTESKSLGQILALSLLVPDLV